MKEIYRQLLENPPQEARNCTRWWWYGCAVTEEEIVRQLGFMQQAGIGGVEIQVLYAVSCDNADGSVQNVPYFSPRFFELVAFACCEAEKRGMTVDFTLGSSWPYGGSFVPDRLAAQGVTVYTIDVTGPCRFSYDFTSRAAGEIIACAMGLMEHSRMLPETVTDISGHLRTKELFQWPWGMVLDGVDIPSGDYKIVAFVRQLYNQQVGIPAPGAEGNVIDHGSREAAELFFRVMGDTLIAKIGRGRIASFFCDSLELEGHNWTSDLFGEFEKRRGYRLQPYLYALYGELEDIGEGVRYDFHLTMSELMNENFIGYMTDWCHRAGSRSRIQAHGAWSDILMAYGLADIPEGETFSPFDRLEVNTVHRRIASSAAHLYGRPVVSNESFTWLRFPRFTETPEQIKAAADSIFLDGMNKIYNHGYSYSPENAEGLGWPFYASSHICHTNPWWPWFHHLADYISRVSAFLQRGHCCSEVLIYLPQSDIWAESPLADLHMSMKLAERLGDDAINGVSRAGYWFDYVNDDILCRASLDNGAFVVGENRYHILLLMETERLPLETARRIAAFAAKGGDVICAGDIPRKGVGLVGRRERDEAVCSIMEPLFAGGMPLKGRALRTADKYDALLDVLRSVRQPDVCIGAHSDTVGYVHRQDGAADIYFLANISAEEQTVPVTFRDRTAGCELIDPMTGVTVRPIAVETQAHGTTMTLRFSPFQSILAVFEPDMAPILPLSAMAEQGPETLSIDGDWRLVVESMGFDRTLETLNGWEKEAELTWYSGTGIYSRTVLLSFEQAARKCALCFEHIGVVATVSVNGRQAGHIIKRPLRAELTGLLRAGENTIEVTVANLLINRAIDPAAKEELYKDDVIDEWPYFTGALNETRKRRIFCEREREAVKEPYPSGIGGSVWLEFSE